MSNELWPDGDVMVGQRGPVLACVCPPLWWVVRSLQALLHWEGKCVYKYLCLKWVLWWSIHQRLINLLLSRPPIVWCSVNSPIHHCPQPVWYMLLVTLSLIKNSLRAASVHDNYKQLQLLDGSGVFCPYLVTLSELGGGRERSLLLIYSTTTQRQHDQTTRDREVEVTGRGQHKQMHRGNSTWKTAPIHYKTSPPFRTDPCSTLSGNLKCDDDCCSPSCECFFKKIFKQHNTATIHRET